MPVIESIRLAVNEAGIGARMGSVMAKCQSQQENGAQQGLWEDKRPPHRRGDGSVMLSRCSGGLRFCVVAMTDVHAVKRRGERLQVPVPTVQYQCIVLYLHGENRAKTDGLVEWNVM